ncbi:MAG TPA: DNRLRE domain-containing protein [bacterium]|nr:DNRLRE domain-containing protein [bacterium]
MKEPLIDRIQSQMSVAEVREDALVTARFEILETLIFSEAWQGQAICDPYNPSLEIDQPLRFVKNGKEVHAIRPAEAFILDEHQEAIDTGAKNIRTAQLWRLSRNGPGVAEMSVSLQDLADAPKGDVCLDPSTTFGPPSRDAFLKEGISTNWGSATCLPWFYDDRPVLGFDVSSFGSDKVVTSAKLKIYVYLNTNAGDAQARAYNVTTAWDESTVNWYDPWTNDGGDYTTDNQSPVLTIPSEDDVWIEFNVTDAFKARYPSSTSDISSKGYLLRYQSDPEDKIKFYTKEYATVSKRPKMEVEYATVNTVTISDEDPKLYSPRSRTITATITPAVSGVPVTFEIIDPDDPADNTTIDASSAGNDNKGPAGSLNPSGSVQTNGSGQAQVTFSTSSMVGGDNYVVRASVSGTSVDSSEMVVWRRVRIEYDAMVNTPQGYYDSGGGLNHTIHDNYLNGATHGLQAILSDTSNNYNRCTFITPVIASSPPESLTSFCEFILSASSTVYSYNTATQSRNGSPYFEKLHMVAGHLYKATPESQDPDRGVCGIAPSDIDCFYIFWDNNQYRLPDIDAGGLNNVWIIAHELGHKIGADHHYSHGLDDVAGLSGHDCIMTQDSDEEDFPRLNLNGQVTKRFGPTCVRDIRDFTGAILE